MSDDVAVDVDGLAVTLADHEVLRDVSFSAPTGSLVGVVGPNGSGKTTLLRTISGVLTPDSGRVTVCGEDVHDLSSRAASRLVSVVPQDTQLSFGFDVRSVVEMGRTPHRSRFASPTRDDRAAVDRALERTRTAQLADRSVDAVSGGERQRVLIARALAQDTPVVLLDEPTASLDVNHQVETLELVADLVEAGKTVIAAIHDLDLAARYCDSIVVLSDGRVLETGPPETVFTAERIETAYGATATVTTDPLTNSPSITAFRRPRSVETLPDRVHVVGSGSAAAATIARLERADVAVTLGPVAPDDAVAVTATGLGVEPDVVEPFSPLDDAALSTFGDRLDACDAVVLADLHLGAGNQRILEALRDASGVVVLETTPLEERHWAGARARELYESIRERGLRTSPESVLEAVRRAGEEPDGGASCQSRTDELDAGD